MWCCHSFIDESVVLLLVACLRNSRHNKPLTHAQTHTDTTYLPSRDDILSSRPPFLFGNCRPLRVGQNARRRAVHSRVRLCSPCFVVVVVFRRQKRRKNGEKWWRHLLRNLTRLSLNDWIPSHLFGDVHRGSEQNAQVAIIGRKENNDGNERRRRGKHVRTFPRRFVDGRREK